MWEPGKSMGWNFKNLGPEQQQRMLRFSTFVNKGAPEQALSDKPERACEVCWSEGVQAAS
jgi:hypothetical protein